MIRAARYRPRGYPGRDMYRVYAALRARALTAAESVIITMSQGGLPSAPHSKDSIAYGGAPASTF
eukprot:SAG31_NODE_44417_length_263_cov_0.597561_1_plen_64_part_01